ncbi:hypothetical protein DOT_0389 [Desulfosporosinus sp. OT]|nr:hypothetical protein DOT_0389 [Desulfosporosinus sp. OT]
MIADSGGLNSTTRMTWDAADHLRTMTTPLNNTYTYEYDPLGNRHRL